MASRNGPARISTKRNLAIWILSLLLDACILVSPVGGGAIVSQVYKSTGKNVSIRFVNFWKGFDPCNNFFVDLIENDGFKVHVTQSNSVKVDLEIVSVFFNRNRELLVKSGRKLLGLSNNPTFENRLENLAIPKRTMNSIRRIWYTGENLRVPFDAEFDGYLSYDPSSEILNNAYLPLWMLSLGWFSKRHYLTRLGVEAHVTDLLAGRRLVNLKSKHVCAFVGNPEPVRLRTIQQLSKLHQVDVFGSYYGNFVHSKYATALEYKYSISFENDLYPGYVTEKIVESYLSLNVPIYRGLFDPNSEIRFNPEAFIDFNIFENTNDLGQFIRAIGKEDYERIYSQPLLLEIPKLEKISKVILG